MIKRLIFPVFKYSTKIKFTDVNMHLRTVVFKFVEILVVSYIHISCSVMVISFVDIVFFELVY